MRPWILVAGDFVSTGGMDAANHALAHALARRGRPVHLVGHRVSDDLRAVPGIRVHRVPRPLRAHALGFPLLDLAGRRVAALLRERDPVVLGNGGNCSAARAVWLHYVHAADRQRPSAVTPRRVSAAVLRWSALRDERRVVRRATVVIANSELTACHARELLSARPERVAVAYYGADPSRFRPPSEAERRAAVVATGGDDACPRAIFVGALGDRRKGFDTVLEAWRRLRRSVGWDTRLRVVGSGAELPAWRRRVARAGLEGVIDFTGFVDDVRPQLWAADLLVAPSRYEAYGLAVQEALCCGLPAVVSSDAGVAERLGPELTPLLLRDPDDPGQLAERLLAWSRERYRWRAAAATVGERLRAWRWDDMADAMIARVEGVA